MPTLGRRAIHSVCAVLALAACIPGCLPIPVSVTDDIVIDTDNIDALLDRYTHSYADPGCTMQLLTTSDQSYVGFMDVIGNAQHSIDIETLDFDNDTDYDQDIALEFARLLADKARAGVRVRVLLDSFTHAALSRPGINQVLIDGGVDVREYRPDRAELSTGSILFRMHKKILVADGAEAIIGGSNYGFRYQGPDQWRDTNALLTGPVATTIQREFDYDWDNRSGPAHLLLASAAQAAPSGPYTLREIDQKPSEDDFDINHAVIIALRVARQRVHIQAPYFNPTDWLIEELAAAVSRGVDVRVLVNSETSNDISQTYYTDAASFETVLNRGIRLFLWDYTTRTMHSKAMIVDQTLAMVGTYNFNARSILWDTENAIFTTDPAAITLIDEMIQNDFAGESIREIDLEWVRSQPTCDQITWQFFGLFAPLF